MSRDRLEPRSGDDDERCAGTDGERALRAALGARGEDFDSTDGERTPRERLEFWSADDNERFAGIDGERTLRAALETREEGDDTAECTLRER